MSPVSTKGGWEMWPFRPRRTKQLAELFGGSLDFNETIRWVAEGTCRIPKEVRDICDNLYPREKIGRLLLFNPVKGEERLTAEEAYRRAWQLRGYRPCGIREAEHLVAHRTQIPIISGVRELHFPATRGKLCNEQGESERTLYWSPLMWRALDRGWEEYPVRYYGLDSPWEMVFYGEARIVVVQVAP
jgi:hypothetical protein